MTFDPTSVEVLCVTLPKDHCVQVPWKYIKVCGYSDLFCKNLKRRSLTPRWPLTPHLLRSHVWLYPRIIVSKSHEHTWKYVDTVTFFAKKNLNQRLLTPRWPSTPHLLRSHVWLYPRIIVSKSHEHTWKYVDTVTFLPKNLNQRSLTPRWPLTPHLLRSHVWLYPRIIVSKSHENTSKYVDTVNLFVKTWTKGHWPLDDLWPHICWGHMCDSSQGSLCPSSMGIHQCMWIQWSILQKLPHTYITHTTYTYYIHTHTTYTYYIQNQWSHSLSGETTTENERGCPTDQVVISGCPPKFLVVHKLPQSDTTTYDQESGVSVVNLWTISALQYSTIYQLSGLNKLTCWKSDFWL